ncbi:unnamed protein product, partial [Staurois parvus]
MGCFQELSEFKHGTVIGCHLCNKSIHEIFLLLNIPQSVASDFKTKWKQLGTTATQPRSEQGHCTLKCKVHRSHQLSAESIAKDLQTSCGLQISIPTVHRELHGMG